LQIELIDEVTASPTDVLLVFLTGRIENDFQELLISTHATHIFRWAAPLDGGTFLGGHGDIATIATHAFEKYFSCALKRLREIRVEPLSKRRITLYKAMQGVLSVAMTQVRFGPAKTKRG
jgi:hypothetical protein